MEIWKDIKGYEGLYQVSNLGRVKSLERRVCNHKSGSTRLIKEHTLTPTDNGYGYKVVYLLLNRNRKNHYVHRLVAEHFIDKPLGKDYVNHIDYDKSNNVVTNLEWCTQSENIEYSADRMKHPKTRCRTSNTGEKYISRRVYREKYITYRVVIRSKGIDKSFPTLDDALCFRNEVM